MSDTIQSAWSNDDLLDQLITRANQASIISESNDIRELRQLVLGRMERTARAEDAETVRAPGDWKDALAKKLASVAYNADMHTPGGYCLMLADFKTTLLDMQLALSRLSAGKVEPWISAKDRLPESAHHVLCVHGGNPPFIGFYYDGEWSDLGTFTRDVTHWMPFPEPPITPSGKE
jgi:hypothetical protein